jgi:hypothetical protein
MAAEAAGWMVWFMVSILDWPLPDNRLLDLRAFG